MTRPGRKRGARTAAWVGVGLLAVAGLVYVVLLPIRQAPLKVVDHELAGGPEGLAIVGRLRNQGEAAPRVLVEAYLYDSENRYLGTARAVLDAMPSGATTDFRIPLDSRTAERVGRYSLYAGTEPNPFAPDPR